MKTLISSVLYSTLYVASGVLLVVDFLQHHPLIASLLSVVMAGILLGISSPTMIKMYVYLILAPWYSIKNRNARGAVSQYHPLVSIVIPAFNEQVGILNTIKTLLESSYRFMEIIVVNDGSTDGTDATVRGFLVKYERELSLSRRIPIVYVAKKNGGKGAALNSGIAASHGDIIVSIDADCEEFVKAFQDPAIMAACGNVKVYRPRSILAHIQMIEYACSFYARKADAALNTLYVISGAAGAFRREALWHVGGYHEQLRGGGEDSDLGYRLQQTGMRVAFASRAVIYTEVPETIAGLAKQRARWARSRFDLFRRYPRRTLSKNNVLLNWLIVPLTQFNDWLYLLRFSLRLALYAIFVATGNWHFLVTFMVVTTLTCAIPLAANSDYRKYLFLAPIYWLLSLFASCIEAYAIWKAITGLMAGRQVEWQKWNRQGLVAKK